MIPLNIIAESQLPLFKNKGLNVSRSLQLKLSELF